MRKTTRFVVTTAATLALFAIANTANAGEPFHPIYQPIANMFRWIFGF